MTKPHGLVSVKHALEQARKRFKPNHFELDYELSVSRRDRMALAGITSDPRISADRKSRAGEKNISFMGFYRMDIIQREISVAGFLNRPHVISRTSRSANIDDVTAFIGKYPEVARQHFIVCNNTGLFDERTDFLLMVGFEPSGNGFTTRVLDRSERTLLIDDVVITKK